jgi:hypothetical protein
MGTIRLLRFRMFLIQRRGLLVAGRLPPSFPEGRAGAVARKPSLRSAVPMSARRHSFAGCRAHPPR